MADTIQPQEVSQDVAGALEPHPITEGLGAEETTPKKPIEVPKPVRTYTQEEWSKRESEKDKETAAYRQSLAEIAMQAQMQEMARREQAVSDKDKTAVEQGLMTQEDATEREQIRRDKLEMYVAAQQLQQQKANLGAQQEGIARVKVAQVIAKKYGVDAEELLKDKTLASPVHMVEKASSLALERMEARLRALESGEPQYDRGQSGSTGAIFDKMTGEEKIEWGLRHPRVKK